MEATTELLGYKAKNVLIADIVRKQIMRGTLKSGDRLLSDDELARKYQVNKRTVAAGLNTLVKEGLLERAPSRGTIVTRDIKHSNAVGLLMLSEGDIYGNICQRMSKEMSVRALYPILINSSIVYHPDCVIDYLNYLDGNRQPYGLIIDGDLNFPFDYLRSNISRFDNIVFIIKYHHPEKIETAKYVLVDFAAAGRKAAHHFIGRGYRKLSCLAVPEREYAGEWSSMQVMIMRGFAEACHEAGVDFDEDIFWRLLHGAPFKETVTEYLGGKNRPDAFFCYADDTISTKIIPILNTLKISYPQDIEFIGFYDTPQAVAWGFSSISIKEEDIANAAVKLLTNELETQDIVIVPELTIRSPKY